MPLTIPDGAGLNFPSLISYEVPTGGNVVIDVASGEQIGSYPLYRNTNLRGKCSGCELAAEKLEPPGHPCVYGSGRVSLDRLGIAGFKWSAGAEVIWHCVMGDRWLYCLSRR